MCVSVERLIVCCGSKPPVINVGEPYGVLAIFSDGQGFSSVGDAFFMRGSLSLGAENGIIERDGRTKLFRFLDSCECRCLVIWAAGRGGMALDVAKAVADSLGVSRENVHGYCRGLFNGPVSKVNYELVASAFSEGASQPQA